MTRRRASVLLAAATTLALLLSGCAAAAGEPGPGTASPSPAPRVSSERPGTPSPSIAALPVRVAAVGDSNTTGFRGTLEAGVEARAAWVALLPPERFEWVGGWAQDGATTTVMAENAPLIENADVVVIMGGTNDLAYGLSFESSAAALDQIAGRAGPALVVVAGIAPFDIRPAAAVTFNDHLGQLASDRGWLFIDPWRTLRADDGTWVAPHRTDGVHTSPAGYSEAAAEIARQLSDAFD